MQCVQLLTTRGDSSGSLVNYIDSNALVHTRWMRWLVCSGLRWYLLNVLAYVCVHVTDSRTRTKSKFSHSVTSFRSKLLHTSQRLSTSQIFLLSFSLKLRNIASAIIKRLYHYNSLLIWRDLNETYILEIFFLYIRVLMYKRFLSHSYIFLYLDD